MIRCQSSRTVHAMTLPIFPVPPTKNIFTKAIVPTVKYLPGYLEEYDETLDNSEMTREAGQILRIMTNPRHLNLHISPSRRPSTNSTGEQINHLVSNMFRITGSVAVSSSQRNNNVNKTRNKRSK